MSTLSTPSAASLPKRHLYMASTKLVFQILIEKLQYNLPDQAFTHQLLIALFYDNSNDKDHLCVN